MTSAFNLHGVFIAFMFLNYISIDPALCESYNIYITNDSPALVGANITFFTHLPGYSGKSVLTYIFEDNMLTRSFQSRSLNASFSLSFPSDLYVEERYRMNITVKVTEYWWLKENIASNHTYFDLKKSLIGEILIYQGNRSVNEDIEKIAVGENFTAVVSFHDPNHYLKDAEIDYTWSFDMDHFFTSNNSFTYNFSDVGSKLIIVKPKATFSNSQTVSGFFTKNLEAEVPVNHVNVSGNFFLHHGDLLKVNVSCLGTQPFSYCYRIFKENATVDNFTCYDKTYSNTCHFAMSRLLKDGNHQLGLYVGNDVTEIKRLIQIKVFPVTIKPALSTIIIPIVCSLLTFIIIAIGISFYVKQRKRLVVEIADFDFQDESDSYTGERTFFEKIMDSIACRNCGRNQLSCVRNRSESDPLINDDSLLTI